MKVKKIDSQTHWVRVEELLPCKKFNCCHELMSCATTTFCPDGTYDTNHYDSICFPDCMDCNEYSQGCKFGTKHPTWNFRKRERTNKPEQ